MHSIISQRLRLQTIALLPLLCGFVSLDAAPAEDSQPIERILFGSCSRPWLPQPLWLAILENQPQLWIWLGDIVYADTEDMDRLRETYALGKSAPGYQSLRAMCPILGTWDDHDYGTASGDATYPKRAESQQALLDFLDEPAGSPRRKQPGIYGSWTYGPPARQVKVLLLDERYFREKPGPRADLLGETQWRWLEHELTASTAAVHLLGSSNQVLASEHQFDKWADYPASRARMLDLLTRTRPRRLVILSGDRHLGEISRMELPGLDAPLYDITSSGMTHHAVPGARNFWYDFQKEPNRYRLGNNFPGLNFGMVRLDWSAAQPVITMEVRDRENVVRCRATLP
jgi:alkaline phosphatase D